MIVDPLREVFEAWARPRGVCLDRVRGSIVYLDSRAQELWSAYLLGAACWDRPAVNAKDDKRD